MEGGGGKYFYVPGWDVTVSKKKCVVELFKAEVLIDFSCGSYPKE